MNSINENTPETQPVSEHVLKEKYCQAGESNASDVRRRVAAAIAANEENPDHWQPIFLDAQQRGLVMAGRINSGVGTDRKVSLMNCAVQPVGDAMSGTDSCGTPGILTALSEAMTCMRHGQGVGYNFSALRPKGAWVKKTDSQASGAVSFMHPFDTTCKTVESAGSRRGAQMGILNCEHPDIVDFVRSKHDVGVFTQFNLSVGISNAFMAAVEADAEWDLVHVCEPHPDSGIEAHQRGDGLWVYQSLPARELWDQILRSTYDHGEPGVVFLDRFNENNNLAYCETIAATNPCAEQPLPPYGVCNLASINLAQLVCFPFSESAQFDWDTFDELARIGVRMLDNVLDLTFWPLEQQAEEARSKRRVGLGVMGLGSALAMLNINYNSPAGVQVAERIAERLCCKSYEASCELAAEKGAFPLFDVEPFLSAPILKKLPRQLRQKIAKHGIRNSHLNAIAPTGTISLAFGNNVSNGIEPIFQVEGPRRIREGDGVRVETVYDYAALLWRHRFGDKPLPSSFVVAQDLKVDDHLAVLAVMQQWIDTSISKTVNIAVDYPFESFRKIYTTAHDLGLKSLATFRPNAVTGVVLGEEAKVVELKPVDQPLRLPTVPIDALKALKWRDRPASTSGNPAWTYHVKAPQGAFGLIVGHDETLNGSPFEVWVTGAEAPRGLGAIAKILSVDMRSNDRSWLKRKLDTLSRTPGVAFDLPVPGGEAMAVPSAVSAMATLIRLHCDRLGLLEKVKEGPMRAAMIFESEPKLGAEGGIAWGPVDVLNPNTGDDFSFFVREVLLPDGSRRPTSLWFSGNYPKEWDGLCKLLSLDMQIGDVRWVAEKLNKLLTYPETHGSLYATVPGKRRQSSFPSTLAYVAAVLRNRYRVLGLIDSEGSAVEQDAEPLTHRSVGAAAVSRHACLECGSYALIKRDGCTHCDACGAVGDCG